MAKTKLADKKTFGGPIFKEIFLEGLKHEIIYIDKKVI